MHHAANVQKETKAVLRPNSLCVFCFRRCVLSRRMDCLRRTNTCASATIGANVGIDGINITFRDSFYGAFADASATSYAVVSRNYMSHDFVFFKLILISTAKIHYFLRCCNFFGLFFCKTHIYMRSGTSMPSKFMAFFTTFATLADSNRRRLRTVSSVSFSME